MIQRSYGDDPELDVLPVQITQRGGVDGSKAIIPVILIGLLIAIATWR